MHDPSYRPMRLTTLGVMASVLAVVAGLTLPAAAGSRGVALTGDVPAWAIPANLVRTTPGNQRFDFRMYLGWRDDAGLTRLADSVSNPSSSNYRRFLTPTAFFQRFSPSAAAVASVQAWLRGQGFTLGAVPRSRLWVPAEGTVSQAEGAFHVRLNQYRVGGQVLRAPAGPPLVPASLAGIVQGIPGLTDIRMKPASSPDAPPPPAFVVATPCSKFWAQLVATSKPPAYGEHQPFTPCGYTPTQLQGAYGVQDLFRQGYEGQGQTVAVVDAFHAPTMLRDLRTYSRKHRLPPPRLTQYNVPARHGDNANKQGWYGEETLDLESIHSMAPRAALVYEGAKSNNGTAILDRVMDVIDHHRAEIISNSYGHRGEQLPQSDIRAEESVYRQAVAEGIGVYFSSGDCGDNIDPNGLCGGAGYKTADYPASSAYVTAVGGTSLAVGPLRNYQFETGWGTSISSLVNHTWQPDPPGLFLYGAGGGPSRLFDEPDYQKGVVPPSLSGYYGGRNRVVPDVGLDGDPNTGFRIGETQTFPDGTRRYSEFRIGGTSLSCPLMAGIMALVNQKAKGTLGFANPALYSLYGTNAFRDITDPPRTVAVVRANFRNGVDQSAGKSFSLRTMNQTGTLHTVPGYDDVTGIGTPVADRLADALS